MMKNKILALYLGFLPLLTTAQNPIIQTKYTADPAPMVHNDTLFLYVGCDEKDAPSNAYLMREYRLYTTTDMVNWTDCGAALKTSDFKWSAGDASAAQCIERDGKFYWYISSQNRFSPGSSIGVAVADTPYGPFRDALGQALVTNDMTTAAKHSWDDLDPTVFIDSNKQAYIRVNVCPLLLSHRPLPGYDMQYNIRL
jgi:arabinoxylan arabinofuranohydrolase